MNLSLASIIAEHGPVILDALDNAHERLNAMDLNRKIPDIQTFLDSMINNPDIIIPISTTKDEEDLWDVYNGVGEAIAEISENIENAGKNVIAFEGWVVTACWVLELKKRGQSIGDPVIMGASPLAVRIMAMLRRERLRQDIADDEPVDLSPTWDLGLRQINDGPAEAQAYLDMTVPNITETKDAQDTSTLQYKASAFMQGHISDISIELNAGEITTVIMIPLNEKSGGAESDFAVFDGRVLCIQQNIPLSILSKSIGQPVETIFDHEVLRGLGYTIAGYDIDDNGHADIVVADQPNHALTIQDYPSNWW